MQHCTTTEKTPEWLGMPVHLWRTYSSNGHAGPVAGTNMSWHSMFMSANNDSADSLISNLLLEIVSKFYGTGKLLTQV